MQHAGFATEQRCSFLHKGLIHCRLKISIQSAVYLSFIASTAFSINKL